MKSDVISSEWETPLSYLNRHTTEWTFKKSLVWISDPWRWNRWVFPKRLWGITANRCVIAQKSAILKRKSCFYTRHAKCFFFSPRKSTIRQTYKNIRENNYFVYKTILIEAWQMSVLLIFMYLILYIGRNYVNFKMRCVCEGTFRKMNVLP